uniref:Uncharacterized protein n=1 Tax=Panagrolaimus sp. ES5 TaxID=591445 RepID=A0AC34F7F3_9BILA
MEICQVSVDSKHIFALNVEDLKDFNANKNEKDMFLKTLQGLFGKCVNSSKAALKHSLLETYSSKKYLHDIVLFGFNKAHVDPVYEILEHEVGDIKKIEYQQHCHEEEMLVF